VLHLETLILKVANLFGNLSIRRHNGLNYRFAVKPPRARLLWNARPCRQLPRFRRLSAFGLLAWGASRQNAAGAPAPTPYPLPWVHHSLHADGCAEGLIIFNPDFKAEDSPNGATPESISLEQNAADAEYGDVL
jgi:hypothetical protein